MPNVSLSVYFSSSDFSYKFNLHFNIISNTYPKRHVHEHAQDPIKHNGMGGARRTFKTEKNCIQSFARKKLKDRYNSENLGVDRK